MVSGDRSRAVICVVVLKDGRDSNMDDINTQKLRGNRYDCSRNAADAVGGDRIKTGCRFSEK